jgi:hypothetical protein
MDKPDGSDAVTRLRVRFAARVGLAALVGAAMLAAALTTACSSFGDFVGGATVDTIVIPALHDTVQIAYPKVISKNGDRYYPQVQLRLLQGDKDVFVSGSNYDIHDETTNQTWRGEGLDADNPVLTPGSTLVLSSWFEGTYTGSMETDLQFFDNRQVKPGSEPGVTWDLTSATQLRVTAAKQRLNGQLEESGDGTNYHFTIGLEP